MAEAPVGGAAMGSRSETLSGAVEAMRERRWSKAAGILDDYLKQVPDDLAALYYRAICYRETAKALPFLEAAYRPTRHYADDWTRAVDRFERILARDSLFRDVLYQYALLWRNAGKYAQSLSMVEAQLRLHPGLHHVHVGLYQLYSALVAEKGMQAKEVLAADTSAPARYARGEALRRAGRLAEADSVLRVLASADGTFPRQPAMLARASIAYVQGRPEEAQAWWERAIDAIDGPLAAALVFEDVKYIVDPTELGTYRRLTKPAEFRAYFRDFWQRRDPAPSLPWNLRMEEHYRRLRTAETAYAFPGPRLWHTDPDKRGDLAFPAAYALNDAFNDMGLVYLRLGEPVDQITTLGPSQVDSDPWTPRGPLLDTPALNASWRYERPRTDFHFVLEGGGANWRLAPTFPLHPAAIRDRARWGGLYADAAQRLDAIDNMQRSRFSDLNMRVDAYHQRDMELVTARNRLAEASRAAVARGLSTDRFTWPARFRPLEVPYYAAAFRDTLEGHTRLEVYYGLQTDQLNAASSAEAYVVELGLAALDAGAAVVAEEREVVRVPVRSRTVQAFTGSLAVHVPPDSYHVALHARSLDDAGLAAYRLDRRVPDFSQEKLAMSDLLLAHVVEPKTEHEAVHTRADLRIIANPYLRFETSDPVFVYFELYHLARDAAGRAHYTLDYALRQDRRGGENVALTLRTAREASGPAMTEHVEIDVRNVPPGPYILQVTVIDQATGNAASREVPLVLYD